MGFSKGVLEVCQRKQYLLMATQYQACSTYTKRLYASGKSLSISVEKSAGRTHCISSTKRRKAQLSWTQFATM